MTWKTIRPELTITSSSSELLPLALSVKMQLHTFCVQLFSAPQGCIPLVWGHRQSNVWAAMPCRRVSCVAAAGDRAGSLAGVDPQPTISIRAADRFHADCPASTHTCALFQSCWDVWWGGKGKTEANGDWNGHSKALIRHYLGFCLSICDSSKVPLWQQENPP